MRRADKETLKKVESRLSEIRESLLGAPIISLRGWKEFRKAESVFEQARKESREQA